MKKDFSEMSKRDQSIYMSSLGMLYGKGIKQIVTAIDDHISCIPATTLDGNIKSSVISFKSPSKQTERKMQIEVSTWLKKRGIYHHHSPNEGKRNRITGHLLKMMGMSAGFPDFIIPYPTEEYHGLFIELKVKNGKVTDSQDDWLNFLKSKNYFVCVTYSAEESIRVITDYLNLSPTFLPAA